MKYKQEIFNIIKSKTNRPFNEDTLIRDLGFDSLDLVEMIADFEEQTGVEIPSEKITEIKTIKNFLEILDKIS